MRSGRFFVVLACALIVAGPGTAGAAPERTGSLPAGQTYSWTGATETNFNPYYFRVVGSPAPAAAGPITSGTCSSDPYYACDDILLEVSNPLTQAEIDKGVTSKLRSLNIKLTEMTPDRVADFDFEVYKSDATGTPIAYWTGASGTSQGGNFNVQTPGENLNVDVETSVSEPSQWMLIRVVRFISVNSSYKGTVTF